MEYALKQMPDIGYDMKTPEQNRIPTTLTAGDKRIMNHTDAWNWELTSPKGHFSGAVHAMDPRDALSRALTSFTHGANLLGIEHAIVLSVIDQAPANFETFYAAEGAAFSITVRKGATP